MSDDDNGPGGIWKERLSINSWSPKSLDTPRRTQLLCPPMLPGRDEDFLGLIAFLVFDGVHLLEACQMCLTLGLKGLEIGAHPLQLLLHGIHVDIDLHLFQVHLILLQSAGLVAIQGNALAAVQFQNRLSGEVSQMNRPEGGRALAMLPRGD